MGSHSSASTGGSWCGRPTAWTRGRARRTYSSRTGRTSTLGGSMLGMILIAILAAFGLSVLVAGVKIIGQAEVMVIERLGRFHRVGRSGLNLLIPFIERPRPIDVRYIEADVSGMKRITAGTTS